MPLPPFNLAKPPVHRKRKMPAAGPTPPAALTLVSASYDPGAVPTPTLTLAFNRAIDITGFAGDSVEVDDGVDNNLSYLALGDVTLIDPVTMRVVLAEQFSFGGSGIKLSAFDSNGIVAVDDGSPWDGVTGLALPFP